MFRSNRLGRISISWKNFKDEASDFNLFTNTSNKPGNITLRKRKSFIRTLSNQTEEYDSESRVQSFLKRGIDPYPNFQFLSAENLNANSSSNQALSPQSSGYNVDTFREVQHKHLEVEFASTNSLPFNDLDMLKTRFSSLEPGARLKDTTMVLAGRILSRRDASAKLIFYDIMIEHNKVQVMASLGNYSKASGNTSFVDAHSDLRRGDIVRLVGFVGKSNAGELTIFATSAPQLLAPCLTVLPLATQLGSLEQRFRQRPLALLLHDPTVKAVKIRAKVLQGIRRYLDARGFLEVETPILAVQAGGAAARPFTTLCRALDAPLHLRISPELYLKQMVVGGFDRVYELGRVFRNESIDPSHNPEFTTCEFYLAYANLETLFQMTEELLGEIVQGSIGSLSVETPDGMISFQAPFSRIHVVDELIRQLGPLPAFDGPVEPWLALCNARGIKVISPLTMTRVLDALIGALIEPQCTQPTFLFGHPLVMSPLAKSISRASNLSARFELFIGKREFINAYEELNSPSEQIGRFSAQLKDRDSGDTEAHEHNQDFCAALSFGLPPTAGWGLGVDRLVSLLSNSPNIRSTLTFPILRPLQANDS